MPVLKKIVIKIAVKILWDSKQILSFWISNGSIRVKLVIKNLSIITHDFNLKKLIPVDPLILDAYHHVVNVCLLVLNLAALQNLTYVIRDTLINSTLFPAILTRQTFAIFFFFFRRNCNTMNLMSLQ